jgi:mRNA-degrading endonuclease RelE of RelBE toxin-antitoxin system
VETSGEVVPSLAQKRPRRGLSSRGNDWTELYRFVDIASFTEDWADLGLGDDELRALEDAIARNPTRAPVVPGGRGVRKIRRPDPFSGKGKSSGYRVLYAFLPTHGIILLIAAWSKSECEDLEPDDYKAMGQAIARIQRLLDQGRIL